MNNFNSKGNTITVPAPAAVLSGVAFIYGVLLAIPVTNAASGEDVACVIEGVVELPKLSTAVITGGAAVNWDSGVGEVIAAAGGAGDLNAFGVAIEAAGNGTTTVKVKLTPGVAAAGA